MVRYAFDLEARLSARRVALTPLSDKYWRGLLLSHDSAAAKATVEKRTGGVVLALPGAPGALASSTIAW